MKVSIIIPNYNGRLLLENNLPSILEAAKEKLNNIIEVVLIDDASDDGSCEYVKNHFPEISIIRHKKNRGFSSSANTGVRTAKGDLIVLLNTDVYVTKSFLHKAIDRFNDKNVFGVSLHERGYGAARGIFKNGFIVHQPLSESNKSMNTFWISGGSGIFRRDLYNKLGGMDEKLFNPFYWEDIDLSYRALKRGYKIIWERDSDVIHQHEATMSNISAKYRRFIQERNQLLFIWKNLTSKNMIKKHIIGLVSRILKHPGYFKIFITALYKLPDVIPARRREIKEGKISDEAIFSNFVHETN